MFGDGTQTRCFCHVADVVRALVFLLDEPRAIGDVFNVGGSGEISIQQLASRIIERTRSSSTIIHLPYEVAYEVGFEDMARRVPDVTKIHALTGWPRGERCRTSWTTSSKRSGPSARHLRSLATNDRALAP